MKKPGGAVETADSLIWSYSVHTSKIHQEVHLRFMSFTLCNILQSLKI